MKKHILHLCDSEIYVKKRRVTVVFDLALYIEDGEVDTGETIIKNAHIQLRNGFLKEIIAGSATHQLMMNEIDSRTEKYLQIFLDQNKI
jgi:hypothetical protein